MEYEHKGFMEKLQTMSESTKWKVLVTATAVIMIVVVYFWLAYFNNLIASVSQPGVADNGTGEALQTAQIDQAAPSSGGSSLLQGMKNFFMGIAHGLGDILQAPRQYIVKPPQ